jgi:hypothetical protein
VPRPPKIRRELANGPKILGKHRPNGKTPNCLHDQLLHGTPRHYCI